MDFRTSCDVLGCDDGKQWTVLYREQGLKSEGDSDSKPRYKTNDHEIETLLILSACSVCVRVCVQTVCVKAVSWSQIVASSLLCWGELAGTGYTDRGPYACVMFVYAYGCMSVWRNPVRSAMTLPTACVSTRGDLFSVCVCRWECMCVCPVLQAGKVPVFVCQTVGGDTPFICVWVSLFCCGSSPSEREGLVVFIRFIRYLCLWIHPLNILQSSYPFLKLFLFVPFEFFCTSC